MCRRLPEPNQNQHHRLKASLTESGFTLAELLVVIAVVLLLVLIAIPNLSGMRIQANETAAIESLRSVYQAEVQYQATYPASGFACSLQSLGGTTASGKPTPQSAHVLPADLAKGQKSGYIFKIVHCVGGPITQGAQYTGFEAIAVPQQLGKTGHRGFCVDRRGELKFDPAGGTDCTQSVQ